VTTSVAVVAVAAMISGVAGVVVGGAALGVRYFLRRREKLCEAVTVGLAAGGLTLAGAVLSQNPWRSVDGYAGHSPGVQLLALVSVAMLAASTVSTRGRLAADSQADRELVLEDPLGSHT
jgi:arabinofuranan 3-O-arabinosyltransferase